MRKNLLSLLLCVLSLNSLGQKKASSTHKGNVIYGNNYKAVTDTIYNHGSGINSIYLSTEKVYDLTNLGMLWGFIKYYHPAVATGQYNMDAELFRVLPKVLQAKSNTEANEIMEQWVDGFGKPASCSACKYPTFADNHSTLPDFGSLFTANNFSKTLMDKLAYIKNNRASGSHYYYKIPPRGGSPVFTNEISYAKTAYPDAGLRLLALYRYWNMVQYFFPYRNLIGENWDKVLPDVLSDFCDAKDTDDYQVAFLRLITRINDTHANIWNATKIENLKGALMTPIQAKFIENQLVVTGYYNDPDLLREIIKEGDIIDKIDGVKVNILVERYLPLTPASNNETKLRDLPGPYGFLLRNNNKDVQLTLSENGQTKDVTIARVKWNENMGPKNNKLPGFNMLKGNIGYIFPAYLKDNDLLKIKTQFASTKGIIIDMRCTPALNLLDGYIQWLKPKLSRFVRFIYMNNDVPGFFETKSGEENGGGNGEHYKGKVVIIVNDETQGMAEYTTMAFASIPRAVVIGSKTAGTDGEKVRIELPGGIITAFSGYGVLYPDGAQTQRIGLKIDKVVSPTIKGIKEHKDELLDEAIKIIGNK